ncbi:MAG: zinc ribbon domain-containing protein [Chloroflexi bacterium]|nr:zinc ribbon domain-containing protein [Chloroflexota bacterium]MBI3733377.1 zinc ribbon domain-containing protein [Chloroflexota bacterium]
MPTYEYRCERCRRRSAFNVRGFNPPESPTCPQCGSAGMKRLISRVAILKSEEARLESMADPSNFGDVDENDPKSVARFMRKMGGEMGEELPPEFNEMVDRLDAGESPDSIEQSMGENAPEPPLAGG